MQNPLFGCPKHGVAYIPTRSGMQFVCPTLDCDEHVQVQGPWKEDCTVKPIVKSAPHDAPALTREEREKRIADAIERKKAAAVKPGVVVPEKKTGVKIPAKLNATTGKTKKDVAREARNKDAVDDTTTTGAEVALDVEADANVAKAAKAKKAKPAKDPNALTVSDVARESGVDPKRARSRLRAAGKAAVDGRWPTVTRGTPEHDQLIADIADPSEKSDDEESDDTGKVESEEEEEVESDDEE